MDKHADTIHAPERFEKASSDIPHRAIYCTSGPQVLPMIELHRLEEMYLACRKTSNNAPGTECKRMCTDKLS